MGKVVIPQNELADFLETISPLFQTNQDLSDLIDTYILQPLNDWDGERDNKYFLCDVQAVMDYARLFLED